MKIPVDLKASKEGSCPYWPDEMRWYLMRQKTKIVDERRFESPMHGKENEKNCRLKCLQQMDNFVNTPDNYLIDNLLNFHIINV